jgi:two-component system response regulator NreC
MSELLRVVIVDDHTIFRSGLKLLLSSESDIKVVGEAQDGNGAVELATRLEPNVVLMDIGMPEVNGFEATRRIKELAPDVNILVLTMHRSDEYFFKILEAGASGYILKGAETEELINAVRVVASGGAFLYPSMVQRLLREFASRSSTAASASTLLSPREEEILKLIAEGYTNKEIAESFVISPSTVYSHRTNLMRKLEISSRYELVQYARRHGLIEPS